MKVILWIRKEIVRDAKSKILFFFRRKIISTILQAFTPNNYSWKQTYVVEGYVK